MVLLLHLINLSWFSVSQGGTSQVKIGADQRKKHVCPTQPDPQQCTIKSRCSFICNEGTSSGAHQGKTSSAVSDPSRRWARISCISHQHAPLLPRTSILSDLLQLPGPSGPQWNRQEGKCCPSAAYRDLSIFWACMTSTVRTLRPILGLSFFFFSNGISQTQKFDGIFSRHKILPTELYLRQSSSAISAD